MDYITAEAWAIDRALNYIQNTDNKDAKPDDVIEIAKAFANRMHVVAKESGQLDAEMQKAIDDRVEAIVGEIEVAIGRKLGREHEAVGVVNDVVLELYGSKENGLKQ